MRHRTGARDQVIAKLQQDLLLRPETYKKRQRELCRLEVDKAKPKDHL
jgi:hypothetical protein